MFLIKFKITNILKFSLEQARHALRISPYGFVVINLSRLVIKLGEKNSLRKGVRCSRRDSAQCT